MWFKLTWFTLVHVWGDQNERHNLNFTLQDIEKNSSLSHLPLVSQARIARQVGLYGKCCPLRHVATNKGWDDRERYDLWGIFYFLSIDTDIRYHQFNVSPHAHESNKRFMTYFQYDSIQHPSLPTPSTSPMISSPLSQIQRVYWP